MKSCIRKLSVFAIFFLALATSLTFTGCEGSDADKAVKKTVEELSGKNIVNEGEKIKQQINEYGSDQIEKVQQDILKGTYSKEEENKGESE